jgi:hypothetical protein
MGSLMADNIKDADELILTYVIGHDETDKGGKESIASLLSNLYGTLQTANFTDTGADDYRTIIPFSTGTSVYVHTLPSAASAGEGTTRWIEKVDTGTGYVRVVDDTGAWMDDLLFAGDAMGFTPNRSGTGWHPRISRQRQRRYGGSRYYLPFEGAGGATNTTSLLQDVIYCHIIDLKEPRFIDGLGMSLMGVSPTNWQAKTALYTWDPASPHDPSGAALLSGQGSVVGNGAGTTAQGSQVSTFTSVALPRHGRAWAVSKVSVTATATNQLTCINSPGIAPVIGGSDARQLTGFTTDPIKGFSWATQPFANDFPANLPGSATTVTAIIIPLLCPRLT